MCECVLIDEGVSSRLFWWRPNGARQVGEAPKS